MTGWREEHGEGVGMEGGGHKLNGEKHAGKSSQSLKNRGFHTVTSVLQYISLICIGDLPEPDEGTARLQSAAAGWSDS